MALAGMARMICEHTRTDIFRSAAAHLNEIHSTLTLNNYNNKPHAHACTRAHKRRNYD